MSDTTNLLGIGVVEPLGETYAARPGIFPLPHKKISYKGDNGAGWRQKKLPVEVFSTTGESLLACKLAKATQNKRYKPSDRWPKQKATDVAF